MAEELAKEILPIIEEQKQEIIKKQLYKSWKFYLTTLGIITVGVGVGLGIGIGVHNSHIVNKTRQEQIVAEINNIDYTLPIAASDTTTSINEQITGDFIEKELNKTSTFNSKSFKLKSITTGEDNHLLTNTDLISTELINVKINYNYGIIKNQIASLTIFTTQNLIDLVTGNNSRTDINYDKATVTVNDIKEQMKASLINSITNKEIQNYLKENLTIASLYTSTRVDSETVITEITDERLRNDQSNFPSYWLIRSIFTINNIKSNVITLRLYPNSNE